MLSDERAQFRERVNELAKLETYNRHLYRPGAYMHKWWARRCGTTFRAILKYLSDEPFDYYEPGGLEGRTVLDPMMGGGTSIYEASRMGAGVIGLDVDPVAAQLVRAGLAEIDRATLIEQFELLFHVVRTKVRHYFETTCVNCDSSVEVKFRLLARRSRCDCEDPPLRVDDYRLYDREDELDIALCRFCGTPHEKGDHHCEQKKNGVVRVARNDEDCPNCDEPLERPDGPYYDRFAYVAERIDCECGQVFQHADVDTIGDEVRENLVNSFDTSRFAIESGPKSDTLLNRGVESFLETFSTFQLAFYGAARSAFRSVRDEVKMPLALMLSTSTEFNNLLCGYKGQGVRRAGAVRHVFSHHGYDVPWLALENNPVLPERSSGNLQLIFNDRILRAVEWRNNPKERDVRGEDNSWVHLDETQVADRADTPEEATEGSGRAYIRREDAREANLPDGQVDWVVTDPPYYDSVQYSDLSQFFRGWLGTYLPDEEWSFDRQTNLAEQSLDGPEAFGKGLGAVLSRSVEALKDDGTVAFTYHHWDPEAWAALTLACQEANLRLEEFVVVRAENSQSVHISGLNSLKHDAVLFFKDDDRTDEPDYADAESDTASEEFVRGCARMLGVMLNQEDAVGYDELKERWTGAVESIKDQLAD